MYDRPELEFFNGLAGQLEIELSAPPEHIGNLDNLKAPPEARMTGLRLKPEIYEPESETFREPTAEELASVAYRGPRIKLRSESEDVVAHDAPNGEFFTVQELLNAVEETERQTRGGSEWFGGVDVHHVFFEGLCPDEEQEDEEIWQIVWGS